MSTNASRPLLRCPPRELKHRGELVPTRNEIMGKIGASIILSYSSLVVSYVTCEGLGFVRVLHSRVVVSSCSYIREIANVYMYICMSRSRDMIWENQADVQKFQN